MSQPDVVLAGVRPEEWRKVSPLSPLFGMFSAVVVVAGALLWNNIDTWRVLMQQGLVEKWGLLGISIAILGAILAIAILFGIYSWIVWRKTAYAVTDQAVWFRTGVVFRSQRHALLERVQEVDLVRPFIPRLFGLGKLRVGVAGSGDLTFGYLREQVLRDLRSEILSRAAGVVEESEAPEKVLYAVPRTRLFLATLLRVDVLLFLLGAAGLVATAVIGFWFSQDPWVFVGTIPPAVALVGASFSEFLGYYGFTAAASPDGLRTRRGLLETRAQTIPPRRVHAVQISQPFFWRAFGWYRVRILQAATEQADNGVLLPVGTWDEARLALWLVIADLGHEDPQGLLESALDGTTADEPQFFSKQPPQSRFLDPLVWKRRGMALTRSCMIVRDGRIRRRAVFVPYARIQSLADSVGPLQRRLGLGSIRADLVTGMFTARLRNTAAAQIVPVLQRLSREADVSRQTETSEKWMLRVEERIPDA